MIQTSPWKWKRNSLSIFARRRTMSTRRRNIDTPEDWETPVLQPVTLAFAAARTYFQIVKTFAQVLDSADELGVEEQESLVDVLQRRLADRRREALLEAVKSARQEFEEGRCRPATPKQIVKRIFA